jgi:hypothetical protein
MRGPPSQLLPVYVPPDHGRAAFSSLAKRMPVEQPMVRGGCKLGRGETFEVKTALAGEWRQRAPSFPLPEREAPHGCDNPFCRRSRLCGCRKPSSPMIRSETEASHSSAPHSPPGLASFAGSVMPHPLVMVAINLFVKALGIQGLRGAGDAGD